ncbi:MAG: CHAT domain-containing protein [Candidatus Krumholzibacteriia bacterium]
MAEAESLTAVTERFLEDWSILDAWVAAIHQLEIRVDLLGPRHPAVATTHETIGQILILSGNRSRAREQLRFTLDLRRQILPANHPAIAATLILYGRSLCRHGGDEDLSCFDEAQHILDANFDDDALPFAALHHARGNALRARGQLDAAEPLYRRTLEILRRHLGEAHLEVADTLVWLAHIVQARGRPQEAEAMIRRARAILLETGRSTNGLRTTCDFFLARHHLLRGEVSTADSLYAACFEQALAYRMSSGLDFGLRGHTTGLQVWAARLLHQGKWTQAWRCLELARGWTTDAIASLSPRINARISADTHLDSLSRQVVQLERMLHALEDAGRREEAHRVRLRLLQADVERMVREHESVDLRRLLSPSTLLPRVQQALDPQTCIIGWFDVRVWPYEGSREGRFERWGHVIRHTGPIQWVLLGEWRSAGEYNELPQILSRTRRAIHTAAAWPTRVAHDPNLDELSSRAWDELVEPLLPYLEGVDRLVVHQPSGGIRRLSVECLRDREGRYLVDRFDVSYTSSALRYAELRGMRSLAAPGTRSTALVVGDPLYAPGQIAKEDAGRSPWDSIEIPQGKRLDVAVVRGALAGDREALARLPRLEFSRKEAQRIASLFENPTLLLGEAASEQVLVSLQDHDEMRGFGVVHLAVHALVGQDPECSALALSLVQPQDRPTTPESVLVLHDGLVTVREMFLGWKIQADLVTLSGCQTGGNGFSAMEGGHGFRQALLKTGARSILVSEWEVDDVATALLMERFYENLTGNHDDVRAGTAPGVRLTRTRALAEAKRWLRDFEDPRGRRPFEHPAYWAGFVLFGDPL